jgi:PIN domain nuclease of toxin-antitoxin system
VIVLDTHVLIWFAEDVPDLGKRAAAVADEALRSDELAVSAISFWEIAMLARKGRLELADAPAAVRRKVLGQGIREIAIDGAIGIGAAQLSGFHGDPADRIIVATALANDATLLTADRPIRRWRGPLKARDARR